MNEQELIAAVKAAKTKDELEALVKGELGIDLDKRRGLDTLRTDILAGLGATDDAQEQGGDTGQADVGLEGQQATDEPVAVQPPAEALVVDIAPSAFAIISAPTESTGLELAPELPELGDEDNLVLAEPAPQNRLLRNRENSREFVWTPELAKLPHMEEV